MGDLRRVIVFDGEKPLVNFALSVWRDTYDAAIAKRRRMDVALSGGRTPAGLYASLARDTEPLKWRNIHIFLVDERFVLPTDKDSNYRMIRERMLSLVPIPEENVHPIPTGGLSLEAATEAYEAELRAHFGLKPGEMPRFDLITLGLGEDGHIASLFPKDPAVCETRLASPVTPGGALHDRITLTLPVISNGRCILLLVIGARKAAALKAAVEGKDPDLPASRVEPKEGHLFFLADWEAGGLLSRDTYEMAASPGEIRKD